MSDVFRATARFIQNVPLGHDQSGKSTVSFYKDADDLIGTAAQTPRFSHGVEPPQ